MFDKAIIEEAIQFLKDNTPEGEVLLVGFSGGKDSIVTEKIVKMSGLPYRLVYSVTGIDMPELVKFIRKHYPHCELALPKLKFWHMVTTKNPPLKVARWCCTKLKKEPTFKMPEKWRVMGIRSEESGKRSKYPRINIFKKLGQTHLYPIKDWTDADVWGFIDHFNLPYPAPYDQGLGRCGCIVCPYHSAKEHEFYRKRYPAYFKMFEKSVAKWHAKRLSQGKDLKHASPEDFLKDWYQGKASWYQKPEKKED